MSRGHDDFLDLPEVRVGRVRTEAEDDGLAGREDSSDVSKALESELPISHGPEKESGAIALLSLTCCFYCTDIINILTFYRSNQILTLTMASVVRGTGLGSSQPCAVY